MRLKNISYLIQYFHKSIKIELHNCCNFHFTFPYNLFQATTQMLLGLQKKSAFNLSYFSAQSHISLVYFTMQKSVLHIYTDTDTANVINNPHMGYQMNIQQRLQVYLFPCQIFAFHIYATSVQIFNLCSQEVRDGYLSAECINTSKSTLTALHQLLFLSTNSWYLCKIKMDSTY